MTIKIFHYEIYFFCIRIGLINLGRTKHDPLQNHGYLLWLHVSARNSSIVTNICQFLTCCTRLIFWIGEPFRWLPIWKGMGSPMESNELVLKSKSGDTRVENGSVRWDGFGISFGAAGLANVVRRHVAKSIREELPKWKFSTSRGSPQYMWPNAINRNW